MIRHRYPIVLFVALALLSAGSYLLFQRGHATELRGLLSAREREIEKLTAQTELLSKVEPLATDQQPLAEVLITFSNSARTAMRDLGISGEIGIHGARPNLPVTAYYTPMAAGFSAIPVLILVHSYTRYENLVAFLHAVTTRFPAILDRLEFDGRRMAVLVMLTGRTR